MDRRVFTYIPVSLSFINCKITRPRVRCRECSSTVLKERPHRHQPTPAASSEQVPARESKAFSIPQHHTYNPVCTRSQTVSNAQSSVEQPQAVIPNATHRNENENEKHMAKLTLTLCSKAHHGWVVCLVVFLQEPSSNIYGHLTWHANCTGERRAGGESESTRDRSKRDHAVFFWFLISLVHPSINQPTNQTTRACTT